MALEKMLSFLRDVTEDMTVNPQNNTYTVLAKQGALSKWEGQDNLLADTGSFMINLNRSIDGYVPLIFNLGSDDSIVSEKTSKWKEAFSQFTSEIANR